MSGGTPGAEQPFKPNRLAGVIVVVLCIVIVLLVYRFTIGAKVSHPVPEPPPGYGYSDDLLPPAGGGASHATPGPTETPVPKPATEKKPRPPGG